MSAILLLLALLSLATLASRRGGFAALLASSLPAFVAGLIAGPRALGYLSAPLLTSLSSATASGLCWLGLLLGWRASRVRGLRPRPVVRAAAIVVVASVVVVLTVFAAARFAPLPGALTARLAIGLLAAAILLPFSIEHRPDAEHDEGTDDLASRALDLIVIVAVIAAVGLLAGENGPRTTVATIVVVVVAVLLGVSALLVGGTDANRRFPAILSTVALVTALAWALDVHVGIAGIGIGIGLSLVDRQRTLDGMLAATAGPVALVVAFLVGAQLPVRLDAAVLGVVVAVVVLAVVIAGSGDEDPTTTHLDTAIQRAASSSTGMLILGGLLLAPTTLDKLGTGGGALGIALVTVDAVVVVAVLIRKGASARRRKP